MIEEISLGLQECDRSERRLPLVRMAVLVGQRDHAWCVVWAEEDRQSEPKTSTNVNLIVLVAEQCWNSANANHPYFALANFWLDIRKQISASAGKKKKKRKRKEKSDLTEEENAVRRS